ncbi:YjcZ family sporulation protein [Bacillus sp. AK031]
MGANVAPSYVSPAYAYPAATGGYDTFVLIVVLFILLIIVGACIVPHC